MREFCKATLRKPRAARAHQQARTCVMRKNVKRAREHICLHYHAGATARRRVIDGAMLVGGVRADVDGVERPGPGSERLTREAMRQRAREHLRKDRQYTGAPHTHS